MAGLTGMKEICDHEGKSEPTMLKWIREYEFPARKIDGVWISDTDLVAEWRKGYVMGTKKKDAA